MNRLPALLMGLLSALPALSQAPAPAVEPPAQVQAQAQAQAAPMVPKPRGPRKRPRRRAPTPAPQPVRRWPGQGDPEVEKVRRCILARESGGDYEAVDPSGRWAGAYQFGQKTADTAARRMKRPDLVGVPVHQWKPEDQDAAFYVIYNRGRGKRHWSGGRYPCIPEDNRQVPPSDAESAAMLHGKLDSR